MSGHIWSFDRRPNSLAPRRAAVAARRETRGRIQVFAFEPNRRNFLRTQAV